MEEKRERRSPGERWLDTATAGIRFGTDRKAVRAELAEHLEDKTLDFLRIFPDLTEEAARERAAAEMGDPEEIGKELAKIHKPWLGWLWRASQVLMSVVLVLTVGVWIPFVVSLLAALVSIPLGLQEELPEREAALSSVSLLEERYGIYGELQRLGSLEDSASAQAGEYTFTLTQGELWTAPETAKLGRVVSVQLVVDHLRPGENLYYGALEHLWAEDDRGNRISSPAEQEESGSLSVVQEGRTLFQERYRLLLEVRDPEAEQVTLRYDGNGAELTLDLSLGVTQP